ncbi:sugar transferase [Bdellovibrio bacteriovorus]|uniref:sugar transferase n=1 Tax=Bdellovibrio bacteriovorus TaxID=959 RepID=UPI003AA974DC
MKRGFDLTLALLCCILLAVPMALTYLGVILFLGKPAIFCQIRPGRYGKPFKMYKFRTMTDARDLSGNLLPDSQRLTKFGLFLRRTSLDELPEIINVLKGEMSFVGPRPLLMQYLPHYTPFQARRHEVLPGITGWAQVNGRNLLSWEDRFKLDVWYVDNHGLSLDIKIILLTAWKVFRREGVAAKNSETMTPFVEATDTNTKKTDLT